MSHKLDHLKNCVWSLKIATIFKLIVVLSNFHNWFEELSMWQNDEVMPECFQFFFRTMCTNKKTYFNQKGMTNHNKEEDIRF